MPVRLRDALATTEPLSAVFDDASVVNAMLAFEIALAKAEAKAGVIPASAAARIAAVSAADLDSKTLAHDGLRAGTLAIPFVKQLTACVRAQDVNAAGFVHWGATSQDVIDTAMALLLVEVREILAADHARLIAALLSISKQHANTAILARTLLQPAPPTTFGLKAAGWYAACVRSWKQTAAAFEECRVLQFGGASGTLASLGNKGTVVAHDLAAQLNLQDPGAPWHTQRDRLASLLCALAVYTGGLGKMAKDISLLMQYEVAEAFEPGGQGRGGSSTMPHKRNPTACAMALASANRIPGLVASFLSGVTQEHERAAGAWQAEWPAVTGIIEATGLALASMVEVAEGLTVDAVRMRANIDATRGLVFAEKAMLLLGAKVGRDKAHHLLNKACERVAESGRPLGEIVRETPEIAGALSADELANLAKPEDYLGAAEAFRLRLLAEE